jgi:hypothetical protein
MPFSFLTSCNDATSMRGVTRPSFFVTLCEFLVSPSELKIRP